MASVLSGGPYQAKTPREVAECVWLRQYIADTTAQTRFENSISQYSSQDEHTPSERLEHSSTSLESGELNGAVEENPSNTQLRNRPSRLSMPPNPELMDEKSRQGHRLKPVTELALTRSPNMTESLTFKRLLHRISETKEQLNSNRIDLHKTVLSTASAGGVTIYEPVIERFKSTHLIWLSDRSLQMSPWREVEERITELLSSQNSFATTLNLMLDVHENGSLGIIDQGGQRVSLSALPYLGRDLLVILFSDGIEIAITDGRLGKLLADLPRGTRVIWLHPWGQRHLGRTPVGKLKGAGPLTISDQLTEHGFIPATLSELSDRGGFELSRWIHYHSQDSVSSRLIPTRPKSSRRSPRNRAKVRHNTRTRLEYVRDFARSASREAIQLLALASATPSLFSLSIDELYALGYHFIETETGHPQPYALRLYLAEALTSGLLKCSDGTRLKFIDAEAQHAVTGYIDFMTLQRALSFMIEEAERGVESEGDALKLAVYIALRDQDVSSLSQLLNEAQLEEMEGVALVFGLDFKLPATPKRPNIAPSVQVSTNASANGLLEEWIKHEADRPLAELYFTQSSGFTDYNYYKAENLLITTIKMIEESTQSQSHVLETLLTQFDRTEPQEKQVDTKVNTELNAMLNKPLNSERVQALWEYLELSNPEDRDKSQEVWHRNLNYLKQLEYARSVRYLLAYRPNGSSQAEELLSQAAKGLIQSAQELIWHFQDFLKAPLVITHLKWDYLPGKQVEQVTISGHINCLQNRPFNDQIVDAMPFYMTCDRCHGQKFNPGTSSPCLECNGEGQRVDLRAKSALWSYINQNNQFISLKPLRIRNKTSVEIQLLSDLHNRLIHTGLSHLQALEELTYLIILRLSARPDLKAHFSGVNLWEGLTDASDMSVLELYTENLIHHNELISQSNPNGVLFAVPRPLTDGAMLCQLIEDLSDNAWELMSLTELSAVYEEHVRRCDSLDKEGLYMTPQPLAEAIAHVLQPKPHEVITDLAAGTGSLLFAAQAYVKKRFGDQNPKLQGVERSYTPHSIMKLRALLSDAEIELKQGDSLSPLVDELAQSDLILCAPPWGINQLNNRDLSKHLTVKSNVYQEQFLQVIMGKLKPGGRAAVILTKITQWMMINLLKQSTFHTVLTLPDTTSRRGVTVVFFQKKINTSEDFQQSPLKSIKLPKLNPNQAIDYSSFINAYGSDPHGGIVPVDDPLVTLIHPVDIRISLYDDLISAAEEEMLNINIALNMGDKNTTGEDLAIVRQQIVELRQKRQNLTDERAVTHFEVQRTLAEQAVHAGELKQTSQEVIPELTELEAESREVSQEAHNEHAEYEASLNIDAPFGVVHKSTQRPTVKPTSNKLVTEPQSLKNKHPLDEKTKDLSSFQGTRACASCHQTVPDTKFCIDCGFPKHKICTSCDYTFPSGFARPIKESELTPNQIQQKFEDYMNRLAFDSQYDDFDLLRIRNEFKQDGYTGQFDLGQIFIIVKRCPNCGSAVD